MEATKTIQAGERTQHTPGPWATDIENAVEIIDREGVNSGRKNDHRIDSATVYIDHGSGKGGEICTLRHVPDDGLDLHDGEYQANARLIAAAPELLEALRRFRFLMKQEDWTFDERNERLESHLDDVVIPLIAKATGGNEV